MLLKDCNQTDYYFACDDAGSAYHIAAFVAQNFDAVVNNRKCEFKLGVPATYVFKEFMDEKKLSKLKCVEEISPSTKTAIIGTGDGFERQEIYLAIKSGASVISIFDNWTDYENRLKYNGKNLEIQTILVTDKRAKKLAQISFPDIRIVCVENQIIKFLAQSRKNYKNVENNLLFLHQPLNKNLKKLRKNTIKITKVFNIIKSELELFYDILEQRINLHDIDNINIRIHPTIFAKYPILKKIKNIDFKISQNTLVHDLSNSNIVVGFDSYALYLSEKLMIKTIRLEPND